MRKPLLIIMTVAILGGLGLYINKGGDKPAMADSTTTVSPATTSPVTSDNSHSTATSSSYKDGTYIGSKANTIYGTVEVSAIISGGKITDIQFLQMPDSEENSKVVAAMAEPLLKSGAINKQSAHIDFVSGATQDSQGFEQSLQAALNQAAS